MQWRPGDALHFQYSVHTPEHRIPSPMATLGHLCVRDQHNVSLVRLNFENTHCPNLKVQRLPSSICPGAKTTRALRSGHGMLLRYLRNLCRSDAQLASRLRGEEAHPPRLSH